MTYAQLIELYFERSNALQWYWTLYVVIIGGLLAFASMRKERDWLTTLLVTILFCFFAYKNLGAIHEATVQRFATLEALKGRAPSEEQTAFHLQPTLQPPQYEGVRNFHVTCDILTVAALWSMELRRRRLLAAPSSSPAHPV